MLGPRNVRDLTRPIVVSLEPAVPKAHVYRYLERTRDLAVVRNLVANH